MPSPFPGMNPYLEQPVFWSSFHTRFMVAIADAITPNLRPKYYVDVETRTYVDETDEELLVGIPDALVLSPTQTSPLTPGRNPTHSAVQTRPLQVRLPMPEEVRERYLEVREVGTDAVITVIEVLSPKNKRTGAGRTLYQKKRQKVLKSLSNLVEIDLLRGNSPMPMTGAVGKSDYRILVSRESSRPIADLYGFTLQEPIPQFLLPLKSDDEELAVDLQAVLGGVYERASYELRIDYHQPVPPPKLLPEEQQWVDELLAPLRSP
ncbi:MAG: DUF4058 family protein [Myxacorys chilensis ATA2-1-KO14]|jgi:hypothetical protein|nr:DUF4058 family protein [Myxacorys chilensis ATA2-1-KO14]